MGRTWDFEVNADDLISNFLNTLSSDTASKGSWEEDYASICESTNIISCPFVKNFSNGEGSTACRISNVKIDISSWRAFLLACCTTNSTVTEIQLHGVTLTCSHLTDLALALNKIGRCTVLKLHYLTFLNFEENSAQFSEAFTAIFSDDTFVEYLSLKGCRLGDDFVAHLLPSLRGNFRLKALNLSENNLTDTVISTFFDLYRIVSNLREVNLSSNALDGDCFLNLQKTFQYTEVRSDDEANFKSFMKNITEKNKKIKDLNKKRKKANLPELPELVPLNECIVKHEGKNMIMNRSFIHLDLSYNPLELPKVKGFIDFCSTLVSAESTNTDIKLIVGLKGVEINPFSENPVHTPSPTIELLFSN